MDNHISNNDDETNNNISQSFLVTRSDLKPLSIRGWHLFREAVIKLRN